MKRSEIKVAVLQIEGSNCEEETAAVYRHLGAQAEIVHLNQLAGDRVRVEDRRRLADYDVLMLPGGFSAGDYVRAGAIFAARLKSALRKDLEQFIGSGKPVGGFCNGFQILVELGALPGLSGPIADSPEAVLHINDSAKYECRPTLLRYEGSRCRFTSELRRGKVLSIPSAHAEGKLLFPSSRDAAMRRKLRENGQVVFRYVDDKGKPGKYPWNPSGTPDGVAALTNPAGNVFGMMPHPERAFFGWQHSDWTRGRDPAGPGDGRALFESVLRAAERAK
ncbi:MAG TPA: phosphoribosylformylglycinamidine synthase subunit PurQ [Candidatus Thermoplasmatota archaeon]|nr:phosphoribosylformylglycinamidine synthase subunit PurQ [Candidatus Thermoplasmatota archaeon]